MDLKGSLVDTNLRIFPSGKLVGFLKTIPVSDQIPYNISQIIEPNSKSTDKSYKQENLKPVHLNTSEVDDLKKIRDSYDKINKIEPIEKKEKGENLIDNEVKENKKQSENKVIKDELDMDKYSDKNKLNKKLSKFEHDDQRLSKDSLNSPTIESPDPGPFLVTSDIDWLYSHIKTLRSSGAKNIPYLHTLLEGSSIEMPENETIKRNPVLEARCVKLRAQQDARDYRKMTKGVDNVRMRFPEDSISYQMKQINRHLIAIGQFIISIFAGFLFGFRGVEWMVGNLDFGFRLLLGVMCALVIALAEIYFLAKKLNEELSIPETVQLGGPVKFADQDSYNYKDNESLKKPHQD